MNLIIRRNTNINFNKAAKQHFEMYQSSKISIEYIPQKSIASCFTSINEGEVDYSVVPFENSSNGQVVPTYDLFRDWFTRHLNGEPNFKVIGEEFVSIHHNLISFADDISKITKLYSHPQAWGQCIKFMNENGFDNGLKIEKIDTSSTSKAVENLTLNKDERLISGAIASKIASENFNVPIKVANIEDFSGNTTRFLVLGNKDDKNSKLNFTSNENSDISDKILHFMTFIIKNNDNFGSLCDILEKFKVHNLNLQTITTRPSVISPWRYVFFVEIWDGDNFKKCTSDLNDLCVENHVIGSFYRSNRFFDTL